MRKIEQTVNPVWARLVEESGFVGAFAHFAPYVGANVKVKILNQFTLESSMALVESNKNYVGTHFGGSLYSMCDPFFMFLLMENLGSNYIVWDKAAEIQFIRPGLGTVTARFHIPFDEIEKIRFELEKIKKMDRIFECDVKDEQGEIVAHMKKTLYIRRKY